MPQPIPTDEVIRAAWQQARYSGDAFVRELLGSEREHYGRQALASHAPRTWPHGTFCRGCGNRYPCWTADWAMGLLKDQGWHVAQVIELIRAVSPS